MPGSSWFLEGRFSVFSGKIIAIIGSLVGNNNQEDIEAQIADLRKNDKTVNIDARMMVNADGRGISCLVKAMEGLCLAGCQCRLFNVNVNFRPLFVLKFKHYLDGKGPFIIEFREDSNVLTKTRTGTD